MPFFADGGSDFYLEGNFLYKTCWYCGMSSLQTVKTLSWSTMWWWQCSWPSGISVSSAVTGLSEHNTK